jgi:hypothetical protein
MAIAAFARRHKHQARIVAATVRPPQVFDAMWAASDRHEPWQPGRPRIEGRRSPASQPAVASADQAIGKIGSAVFPDIKGLLDGGLIFESQLRRVKKSGDRFHDYLRFLTNLM